MATSGGESAGKAQQVAVLRAARNCVAFFGGGFCWATAYKKLKLKLQIQRSPNLNIHPSVRRDRFSLDD